MLSCPLRGMAWRDGQVVDESVTPVEGVLSPSERPKVIRHMHPVFFMAYAAELAAAAPPGTADGLYVSFRRRDWP